MQKNMNTELMSKDLTIEYNQFKKTIIIKESNHKIELISSERSNQYGNPIFDILNWNGFCSISKTTRGDYFNLFLKLNDKYYRAFQKIDEYEEERNILFRSFREVEKIDGKWENKQ